MNRRNLLKGALLGASALVLRPTLALAAGADGAAARLAALERRHGGRLGVSILDTGNGRRASHRGGERFLMCSTFKLLAVAAVLMRVDHGEERMDRRIVFGKDVLLSYAPVARRHVGAPGMSVEELCAAAITLSDNTAANLLLASMGGPAAVTALARRLGDGVTRLDRNEPMLNVGSPGDLRDTTTPDAMLATMQKLLLSHALADASRERLLAWLRACTTGFEKLRAGVPPGWTVGDKTGSGPKGESNDVAILVPPGRKPLLVAAYYADSPADDAARNAVLAEVGRIAASL
ncbi:class A beta-lactamase [Frateuria sp. Soil773]|uniref:class A beta-lactamase n=1 Tax=Frateuria sp. Soil773 TaxID=1736407 RepID=UPI0006F33F79|nr:class A beta-lactamase [Frateuria sp. Soil773]KRE92529.1 class A beta-lactamase [Frateuria sp. Soil773]